MLYSLVLGGLDSIVQAVQIHVGGDDQWFTPIDGVPDGHIQGRRLIVLPQCSLGQPGAVVGLSHDLKLHRPGVIAGEEMDRKLKTLVCTPVGDQLGVGLGISLQFCEDILITHAGKDKGSLCVWKPSGLVKECGQLIREGQPADA